MNVLWCFPLDLELLPPPRLLFLVSFQTSTPALLDFNFLPGLHFSLGKSPTHQFANSASLSVLSPLSVISAYNISDHPLYSPTLTGSISYLTSGLRSFNVLPSKSASLTTVVDRFTVPSLAYSQDTPPPQSRNLHSSEHDPGARSEA